MSKPKILITNDDGIFAPGIYALWDAMQYVGQTTVVAPDTEQSAVGHAITLSDPLRVEGIHRTGGFEGFAVSGTPADCAKIAIRSLMDKKPDVLVSGINRGANLGNNIIYSGTVSAATEGTMLGIPSVAISINSFNSDEFRGAKETAIKVVHYLINNTLPSGTLLNVNVPYCPPEEIKGIKVTRQGNQYFQDDFDQRKDPRGRTYYWMKGKIVDDDQELYYYSKAVCDGYVSITPIHFQMTNESYFTKLEEIIDGG
ncbi:MAG: 5'/3'-nucleotidase SurE [Candidatus Neomarinimicrobiota bacterium]|nr:5'/3'-nucleotidase SurE [Candidatus Neomarinimicrobiota bacterium]